MLPSKQSFKTLIWEHLLLQFSEGNRLNEAKVSELTQIYKKDIQRLWDQFTGKKTSQKHYMKQQQYIMAYLLGFHNVNALRMDLLLKKLQSGCKRNGFQLNLPYHIWDLGCGTGAMTEAVLCQIRNRSKIQSIQLFDKDQVILNAVKKSLQCIKSLSQTDVQVHVDATLKLLPQKNKIPTGVQLITLGYLYTELKAPQQQQLVEWMQSLVPSQNPILIMVCDTANENKCTDLMSLRNQLVQGGYAVLSPCPHQQQCPLLPTGDRCFSEGRWKLPPLQQKIDKITRHPRRIAAASLYGFANRAFLEQIHPDPGDFRVLIGKPLDHQRKNLRIPLYCESSGKLFKDLENRKPTLTQLRGTRKKITTAL